MNKAPIGVFDSGVGGLTVLEDLQKMLPHEDFIYLADSLYCPYGVKSSSEIEDRVVTIGEEMIRYGVKAIVIACNTATANSAKLVATSAVPVIGVIEPTAQAALSKTKNKKIALLATDLTVKMKVYEKYLVGATVYSLGSSIFVPLAESMNRDSKESKEIIKAHLQALGEKDFDTIIYGCTHFILLDQAIQEALPNRAIIDSGFPTGKLLISTLKAKLLLNSEDNIGHSKIFTSGKPEEFIKQIDWFQPKINKVYQW